MSWERHLFPKNYLGGIKTEQMTEENGENKIQVTPLSSISYYYNYFRISLFCRNWPTLLPRKSILTSLLRTSLTS